MHNSVEPSGRNRRHLAAGAVAAIAAGALGLGSCGGKEPATIGGATLAVIAIGTDPLPESARDAPLVVVLPEKPATIPDAPVVRLAVDRKVPWGQVEAIVSMAESRDQDLVFLVARRFEVQAFHLDDVLDGPVIRLIAGTDGMICATLPGLTESKCAQSVDRSYIDPSFARELTREAVKGYGRTNALIELPLDLLWGDVVSSIGGARSCCGDRTINIRIKK